MITRLLMLAAAVFMCADAEATSRVYPDLDQYISKSEVIAVVEVGAPDKDLGYPNSDQRSEYKQATEAAVKRVLKGRLPKTIKVLHGKGLDDALFQSGAGLYLVFLSKKADAYTPFDGWPSSKLIKEDKVMGWERHPYFGEDNGSALQSVLNQIEARLLVR